MFKALCSLGCSCAVLATWRPTAPAWGPPAPRAFPPHLVVGEGAVPPAFGGAQLGLRWPVAASRSAARVRPLAPRAFRAPTRRVVSGFWRRVRARGALESGTALALAQQTLGTLILTPTDERPYALHSTHDTTRQVGRRTAARALSFRRACMLTGPTLECPSYAA